MASRSREPLSRSSSKRGGERDGRTGPDRWLAEGEDLPTTDAEGRWTLDNVPAGENVAVLLKLGHPDYISDPYWGTMQQEQGIDMKALRAGRRRSRCAAGSR